MEAEQQPTPDGLPQRLAVMVNPDWFFLSHFVDRTVAARRAGYDVTVITTDTGRMQQISDLGLPVVSIAMSRHGLAPIAQLRTFWLLWRGYRHLRPDLAWHIGLKSIVFGTAAARLTGVSRIVNAPVGMGFVFAASTLKARILRPLVFLALRRFLNPPRSQVIFENPDDMATLVQTGAVRAQDAVLIQGAGVDVTRYVPEPEPAGTPVILFAARLIREKGAAILVAAARILREQGVEARFLIAGGIDKDSSSAIPETELRKWENEGLVEWLGTCTDMPATLSRCHIFCLPTYYREGLPKVLLEAMACERPCITTDAPGCRDAVRHDDNGLLVPQKDPHALAAAIRYLVDNAHVRRRMGKRGRQIVLDEFANDQIVAETLGVFAAGSR